MLEICVDSVQSAVNAQRGGADRIELCSSLALGGLTPSIGLLKCTKKSVGIPIFCMIRPRHGNFCYDDQEKSVMREDIIQLKQSGADGFVFGILDSEGQVNKEACRTLIAFDVCSNWTAALSDIVELGFSRILTSGQQPNAIDGLESIKEMIKDASSRITIMIGSGVTELNIKHIREATGALEFHGSASVPVDIPNAINMGTSDNAALRVSSETKVKAIKDILNAYK